MPSLRVPDCIQAEFLGRRAQHKVNLTDYLSVPPAEMELEEEDEEFDMQDAAGMGGARVNSDLYDSFITNRGHPTKEGPLLVPIQLFKSGHWQHSCYPI